MKFRVKTTILFVLALFVTGVAGLQFCLFVQQSIKSNRQTLRSHEVIGNLERVMSAFKDADTGHRDQLLVC